MGDLVMLQLKADLSRDLERIARRFKAPKLTLIVRNPALADGDVVLTDDDPAKALAALQRFMKRTPEATIAEEAGP